MEIQALAPGTTGRPVKGRKLGSSRDAVDLVSFLSQLTLSHASSLARAGSYEEAEQILLRSLEAIENDVSVLDLLARINAQQGRLETARKYWLQASRANPESASYVRALARIDKIQQRRLTGPFARFALPVVTVAILAAIYFVVLVPQIENGHREFRALDERLAATESQLAHARESLNTLDQGQSEIIRYLQGPEPAKMDPGLQASLSLIDDELPGVDIGLSGATTTLSFRNGVFAEGVSMVDTARKQLEVIARHLSTNRQSIVITVVGYTNDIPLRSDSSYRSNESLALARAGAVIELLRNVGGIRLGQFSAQGATAANAPYPNSTSDNRARNKTVVLMITDAGN